MSTTHEHSNIHLSFSPLNNPIPNTVATKETPHRRRKTLGSQDTPPQHPSPHMDMDTPPTSSRPTDGAGHGHRAIPTVPVVSNTYVIKDAPLRESDMSTDSIRVRQRRGVMGKYSRSKSAPRLRMRASERLLLRQRTMESGHGSMNNDTEKEDDASSCSEDITNNNTEASHSNNHDSQRQSNSNTQGILSDYIALKLELAELRSQFQHAQCDARSRIEDLQSQNALLQQENTALIESNKVLQEENERLNQSRWFGRSRSRAAVSDGGAGGIGQYYRRSTISGMVASSIQEENLLQDDVSRGAEKKDISPTVGAAKTIRVHQKHRDANNIANDRELYKQIRKQSSASLKKDDPPAVSGDHEEENSITTDDELSKQIHQRRKKRIEESTQLEKESSTRVKSQQRHSNTSTSETSSDTYMFEQQRVLLTTTEDTKSHVGDELCFSIQTESVSSDYLGYSVVQT